jgi:beta-glucosidase
VAASHKPLTPRPARFAGRVMVVAAQPRITMRGSGFLFLVRHSSFVIRPFLLIGLLTLMIPGCGVSYLFNPQVHFPPTPPDAPRNLSGLAHPGFDYFGVATAEYQISGANGKADWDAFGTAKGIPCGIGVDHWKRVKEDTDLIKSLGANAYRFSIEWARLEPSPGTYDEPAFQHYVDEIARLRSHGITPMITLLHFTLPQWLDRDGRGGLLAPDFPERFAAFTHQAAQHFGSQVTLWCTINEPNVHMLNGYLTGQWPPCKKSREEAVAAFEALLRAHAVAAEILHREVPHAQVGVAEHLVYFEPRDWFNPLDWMVAGMSADAFNWAFYDSIASGRIRFHALGFPSRDLPLDHLAGSADFFGMNYYRRVLISENFASKDYIVQEAPQDAPRNDLGWGVYPEGLLQLLRESHRRYQLPIFITENGTADRQGSTRVGFLDDHLYAVALALQEGIPVKGYFHWSLLDNYEGAEGFPPRFGLFQVDYDHNYQRKETPATTEFRRIARLLNELKTPPVP